MEKLADSDELVNHDSGVSTTAAVAVAEPTSLGSKNTELTVRNMSSEMRKERVLGCLQDGHWRHELVVLVL